MLPTQGIGLNWILTAKDTDPTPGTGELETEIDSHVYAVYGLSMDVIAVVEGAEPPKSHLVQ